MTFLTGVFLIIAAGQGAQATSAPALIVLNGTPVLSRAFGSEIHPDDIDSIEVVKGDSALRLYGSAGRHGVISIRLKAGVSVPLDSCYRTSPKLQHVHSIVVAELVETRELPDLNRVRIRAADTTQSQEFHVALRPLYGWKEDPASWTPQRADSAGKVLRLSINWDEKPDAIRGGFVLAYLRHRGTTVEPCGPIIALPSADSIVRSLGPPAWRWR